ncbi:uncharacterized protein LOC131613454 [Vicia villosa]|uniref:uncharacterized protein LOC131613454 n=1 Tax=Vicia villosa TaxID=3911 RepID=UPI00273B008E|nr:uncharacterized protein LOC131613454 [Vicia villosa]
MRKKSTPYCSFQYPSWYYDLKHTQPLRGNQCDNNDNSEKVKHACNVCSKDFQSKKALNGHMRIHKKDNKGIPPPPISSPQNIDLSKYLPEKSHKCSKRNSDINTIDNDHGDRKKLKLSSILVLKFKTVKKKLIIEDYSYSYLLFQYHEHEYCDCLHS